MPTTQITVSGTARSGPQDQQALPREEEVQELHAEQHQQAGGHDLARELHRGGGSPDVVDDADRDDDRARHEHAGRLQRRPEQPLELDEVHLVRDRPGRRRPPGTSPGRPWSGVGRGWTFRSEGWSTAPTCSASFRTTGVARNETGTSRRTPPGTA